MKHQSEALRTIPVRTKGQTMNTDNRFPQYCFKALGIVVGVCREDNPRDVDEVYGPGTYERLFPDPGEEHGAHETLEGDKPCR